MAITKIPNPIFSLRKAVNDISSMLTADLDFTQDLEKKGVELVREISTRENAEDLHTALPNTLINYQEKVGDPLLNSALVAVLNWITRNFPEAPIHLFKLGTDELYKQEHNHPLGNLLKSPNPHYDYATMWTGILTDLFITGNAYLYKLRDKEGKVIALYYFPSWTFEPKWDINAGSSAMNFITYYEYKGGGKALPIPVTDVIHFRDGFDPDNIRKGRPTIRSLIREIYTDNEATNFAAALLNNRGIPSFVIGPGPGAEIPKDKADMLRDKFRKDFGRDMRGNILVSTTEFHLEQIAFNPQEMNLDALHTFPEERIAAVLGIPPSVVGFLAGDNITATGSYKEARAMAYESTIIPLQKKLADQLQRQLLTDFIPEKDKFSYELHFNLAHVRVLQEDDNGRFTRYDIGVRGGWIRVSEARQAVNLPVSAEDYIYLGRDLGVQENTGDSNPSTNRPGNQRPSTRRRNGPYDRYKPNGAERAVTTDAQQRQTARPERARRKGLEALLQLDSESKERAVAVGRVILEELALARNTSTKTYTEIDELQKNQFWFSIQECIALNFSEHWMFRALYTVKIYELAKQVPFYIGFSEKDFLESSIVDSFNQRFEITAIKLMAYGLAHKSGNLSDDEFLTLVEEEFESYRGDE